MIIYEHGNLINALLDMKINVLVHGCNCFHAMGSGIAKEIKKHFPLAYEADKSSKYGDINKLGNYTIYSHNNQHIINLYSQYNYGRDGQKYVSYDALATGFELIKKHVPLNFKIGTCKIGCQLGGGKWPIVESIINTIFNDREIIVYYI